MKKRIFALLLVLLMLVSAAPLTMAAEEDELPEAGSAEFIQLKTEYLVFIIEEYGYYYDGEDVLGDAIELFIDTNPQFEGMLDVDTYAEFFESNIELYEEFANQMFLMHDKYSHFMEAVTYESSYVFDEKIVGIGIQLDDGVNKGVYILSIVPNSPAQEAGLLPGDQIVEIDGVDSSKMYYEKASELLRGEEDTDVSIVILRKGERISFDLVRREIVLSNITFEDMGGGVAYIGISHFGDSKTFFDFIEVYEELPYNGFRSVIIDLRYNPGGDTETTYNMLNYVLWEADLPMFGFDSREETEVYTSLGAGWKPNTLLVLVNEYSASASELFAGALWVNNAAILVGTPTYGKGVGQYHFELADGSTAIITNFEVFLGDEDYYYNDIGLIPDVIIDYVEFTVDLSVLESLGRARILQTGSKGSDVLAVEQRLQALGFFNGTPDSSFDRETLRAVNAFQGAVGLPVVNYFSYETRFTLNQLINYYGSGIFYIDAALDAAVEFAATEALRPLDYELTPRTFEEYDEFYGE